MKTTLYSLITCTIVLLAVPALYAAGETSSGTLDVTGTVEGSINLTFVSDGSGVTLTGTGTATATLPFSTVQAFGGSVPSGVLREVQGETSFSVATPFDVRVVKANTDSTTYTLKATLGSSDSVNGWLVDAVDIHLATEQTITSTGAYSSNAAHTLKVTVPFTNNTGSVGNTISFTATAN